MTGTSTPALQPLVARVLSNNAVLVGQGAEQHVLVGRGIGFGVKAGQAINIQEDHQKYVYLTDEQVQFFNSVKTLDSGRIETFSTALDLAADLLGPLDPSVYVIVVEHLSFAVDRLMQGEAIMNALAGEIQAVFPEEYAAAEVMLQYINTRLTDVELPSCEAGFLALHLNAALGNTSVKTPLAQAHQLAELVAHARSVLGIEHSPTTNYVDGLESMIARLMRRLRSGTLRDNYAAMAISSQLHRESVLATEIICRILHTHSMPSAAKGEAAYLAVYLHGCWQDHHMSKKGNAQHE